MRKKPLLWTFDLETSGLPHEADKVVPVQIAGVMIDPNQEGWPQVGEFQTFLSLPADAHRSEYAMAMHAKKGRDEAFFAEAGMPPALAYTKLAEWLSGFGSKAVPVAHNAPFDVPLLKRDAFRHGINLDDHMDYHSLDTAAMAFERYVLNGDGSLPKVGLKNLAPFLGVEFDETAAHDAMYDVKATAECLRRMMAPGFSAAEAKEFGLAP